MSSGIYRVWRDGWQWLALTLIVFHATVPFVLLLWRSVKESVRALAAIAGLVLVMQLMFQDYQVLPVFHASGWREHWMDVVAPVALGGIWLAAFLWRLEKRPLLPRTTPAELSRQDCGTSTNTRRLGEAALSHGS